MSTLNRMGYYSVIMRNELSSHAKTLMNLKYILLRKEASLKMLDTVMIPFI